MKPIERPPDAVAALVADLRPVDVAGALRMKRSAVESADTPEAAAAIIRTAVARMRAVSSAAPAPAPSKVLRMHDPEPACELFTRPDMPPEVAQAVAPVLPSQLDPNPAPVPPVDRPATGAPVAAEGEAQVAAVDAGPDLSRLPYTARFLAGVFDSAAPPHAKLALCALVRHAGGNGVAWPSQETLAREIGVGEKTVRRYLKAAEKAGLVIAKKAPRGAGVPGCFNVYRLRLCDDDRATVPAKDARERSPGKGRGMTGHSGGDDRAKGRMSPDTRARLGNPKREQEVEEGEGRPAPVGKLASLLQAKAPMGKGTAAAIVEAVQAAHPTATLDQITEAFRRMPGKRVTIDTAVEAVNRVLTGGDVEGTGEKYRGMENEPREKYRGRSD